MITQLSLFQERQSSHPVQRRNDVRAGDAAEAFVIAKLLKWGYDAHGARRDLPYDVVVDVGEGQICRVQVKGRRQADRGAWSFRAIRGNWRSATGTYAYTETDYDVSAFVALSLEKVMFVSGVHASFRAATADFMREDVEEQSWVRALAAFRGKTTLNAGRQVAFYE
ncbi:MAG TPA: group I intron-associated PD-(D/E)XK endonuclease [Microvirga sp.]|jgi:hypothetical protein|nr:group I intron-associated PD-(D/E)XK endonuclease [Microvirga sp.]